LCAQSKDAPLTPLSPSRLSGRVQVVEISRRMILGSIALLIMILVALRLQDRFFRQTLRITFFDVGQGDSALVEFPRGKTMLIDSGGAFSDRTSGRRVLFPELARLGILTLDVALLSHPDLDHGGGFQTLLEEVKAKQFWASGWFWKRRPVATLFKSLLTQMRQRGVTIRLWDGPAQASWENVSLQLWPPQNDSLKENDHSLTLRLGFGGCSFLFLGDLERIAERSLPASMVTPLTVLKVAHHGSLTSSTPQFLLRSHPSYAVISVGQNRYGHPAPRVLNRLRNAGSQVFRTDFHGFVRFVVDLSGKISCETALGSCGVSVCVEGRPQ
jgi:competence protein ComEC